MFQVHPDIRGLIATVPDTAKILQAIPTAFDLGDGNVGMPHDLDSCIRLATLGYRPPAPIQYYYDFPRDRTLIQEPFFHQPITAGFLTTNPHAYCLNGIGTGKTLTAAWAADYLMKIGAGRKAIIGAPLSALERAWADTIFFHFPHRKYAVLHGSAERRRKLLAKDLDFYIINHEGYVVLKNELAERDDIDIWIIDELAEYRNKMTAKWKVLDSLLWPNPKTKKLPKPWVWGLTGAARPQGPTDVYGQCKLITPATVPKYFTTFKNLTMEQHGPYTWTERPEANKIVYDVLRPSIRYSRDDCLDLPGEIYTTRDVTLSVDQIKHYKEINKELYTEVAGGGRISAVNEGVKRSKLIQIACGVVYDVNGIPHEIDAGGRVEELLSTIEQCNEKVIVFVPFTEVTHMLHREVSKHWSAAVVYGAVPKGQRDQIFDDFQRKPDPSVLIAHPACMAHALTLTEASTIVWYAPIDSFKDFEQACGRITRASQKYVANIIMLAGCAAERKMYKRLEQRKSTQGVLMEMVEKGESLL